MKYAAIILVLFALITISAGAYTLYSATLTCIPLNVRVVPGNNRIDEFTRWQTALDNSAAKASIFGTKMENNASSYDFLIYTVLIENQCLLAAEMVEIYVLPVEGDVLCYSGTETRDLNASITISAFTAREIPCILITKAGNHAVREIHITYYIWGHPYTVKCTYG